eukprot:1161489-Pelagomonas_calceolata.AAC.11
MEFVMLRCNHVLNAGMSHEQAGMSHDQLPGALAWEERLSLCIAEIASLGLGREAQSMYC